MNAAPLRRVLSVAHTGGPGQSPGRRVGQRRVAGVLALAAFGLVLPGCEEPAARVEPAPPRPLAALPSSEPPSSPPAPTAAAPSPTSVRTTPAVPRPVPTTAKPVAPPRPVVRATTRPPAPKPVASTCGAASNPWGYNHCGRGSLISSPPAAFCDYFDCIASFWKSTNGHVMRCDDGMYSHSGGRQGSCSHHGGNDVPLYG